MALKRFSFLFLLSCLFTNFAGAQADPQGADFNVYNQSILVGAERIEAYLSELEGKKVAVVGNQSSMVGEVHLVDTLLALGIDVKCVFSPEHGFRGDADAGEKVKDGKDPQTGVHIISLYGKHKEPTEKDLKSIDVIIFDLQDVGVRFYTYISTMHYVMLAAAKWKKTVLVLDRPNPNGHYVDGPVLLKEKYTSFIGVHLGVPVVHGMTVGEYAKMINEEHWLGESHGEKLVCDLIVVPCANYAHSDFYKLPIKPSPNLPNMSSIYLYPSLCFFEGTDVSVGRGTEMPFQIIGFPGNEEKEFSFKPVSIPGASKNPKHKEVLCYGLNLQVLGEAYMRNEKRLNFQWLIDMYAAYPIKSNFFRTDGFFNLLAGNSQLQQQISDGKTEAEIQASWEPALQEFKVMRRKYLLYSDFE
jgi:uncharacterized protein YbbC (DUF1343 family)